jgi:aspartyl-tRNA(Asn)/glutamyl-tRNA(Gln) amidotransferase subunit C
MSLSRQDVAKVGLLSRLALSDAELDTATVEPLAHPLDAANVFRADEPAASLTREQALAAAPRHDGECFLVPAVLGESGAA